MFGIGVQELLLILLIVLILFGAKKVPELAKGLGSALREFKKAAKDVEMPENTSADSTSADQQSNLKSDENRADEPEYKA